MHWNYIAQGLRDCAITTLSVSTGLCLPGSEVSSTRPANMPKLGTCLSSIEPLQKIEMEMAMGL